MWAFGHAFFGIEQYLKDHHSAVKPHSDNLGKFLCTDLATSPLYCLLSNPKKAILVRAYIILYLYLLTQLIWRALREGLEGEEPQPRCCWQILELKWDWQYTSSGNEWRKFFWRWFFSNVNHLVMDWFRLKDRRYANNLWRETNQRETVHVLIQQPLQWMEVMLIIFRGGFERAVNRCLLITRSFTKYQYLTPSITDSTGQ